jgi:FkbM family methyltransferase
MILISTVNLQKFYIVFYTKSFINSLNLENYKLFMLKKKIKSLIKGYLSKNGYNLVSKNSTILTKEFIYLLLFTIKKKNIKIIQIGANNGKDLLNEFNNDYHYKINYIGIEPQEIPFNQLKKTYENFNNFNLIRGCIGKAGKNNFFYYNENYKKYCDDKGLKFSNGVSSLVKENLTRRLNANLNPDIYISKYEVDVDLLYNVLKKNNLEVEEYKGIDLLQVDTEGYDDEVIYNSNLDFFKPQFINFEYKNLNETKLEKLIEFLKQKSYESIIYKHNDCLAVLK